MKKTMILAGLAALAVACGGDDEPMTVVGTGGGAAAPGTGGGAAAPGTGGAAAAPGTGGAAAPGTGGGAAAPGGTVVSQFVEGGLGENGTWSGYLFTAAEAGSTITPDAFEGAQICAEGSLGAAYEEWALIGWNIAQPVNEDFSGGTPTAIAPGGTGVTYNVQNNAPTNLRIQIQTDESGATAWCANIPGAQQGGSLTGTIPWGDFTQECWEAGGAAYDGNTPIMQVAVQVPASSDTAATPFNYCVVNLGPG